MKNSIILLVAMLLTAGTQAQQLTEWRNPGISEINKEIPITGFMSYTSREAAEKNDYTASPYFRSLDGVWKHKRFGSILSLDEGVFNSQYDNSSWEDTRIPTPSVQHTLKGYAREIPEDIPVDVFRTTFHMPFAWADKQLFVELTTAGYVFINGKKAGYSEDRRTPAMFDITTLATEGDNTLVVVAADWTIGSQLEADGEDFHQMLGSVSIKALPRIRVRDFDINTTLSDNYWNGVLDLGVIVKSHLLNPKEVRVYFEFFSPEGSLLRSEYKDVSLRMRQEQTVYFNVLVPDVEVWSAEMPTLYKVMIRIQHEGRYTEYIERKIGFRSVETDGGEIRVNGKAVSLRGINLTDLPTDPAMMTYGMLGMKDKQINAIRLAHSPQPEWFYEMCDRYGLYVFSEANIDSRAFGFSAENTLGNNPAYLQAHLDRTKTVYERTKNYASVIIFSLGDQGGNGYNFYETYLWMKAQKDGRPVVYAGAGREWNTDALVYPAFDEKVYESEQATGTPRPYLVVNDSQSLPEGLSSGRVQGAFLGNQSVGTEHLRYDYFQPVDIRLINSATGEIEVTNHFDFLSLNAFDLMYEIIQNGKNQSKGIISCNLSPGEQGRFTVSLPRRQGSYDYRFTLGAKEAFGMYQAGDVVLEVRQ